MPETDHLLHLAAVQNVWRGVGTDQRRISSRANELGVAVLPKIGGLVLDWRGQPEKVLNFLAVLKFKDLEAIATRWSALVTDHSPCSCPPTFTERLT